MTPEKHLTAIQRVGEALSRLTERWMPDALIIVWLLTFITLALVVVFRLASPTEAVAAWGKGFWELLTPSMQICLMLLTGYVLARAPIMKRALERLAKLPSPEKPERAVLLLSLFSMLSACIHWGLSLMGSGMLAVFLVRRVPKVDYRLLVASAYLGLGCTWHAGLTGTAPLWANTPDNPLMKRSILTYLIPQSRTIFTPFNLTLLVIVIVAVSVLMYCLHSTEPRNQISEEQLKGLETFSFPERPSTTSTSPATRLIWWPGFNVAIVTLGAIWIVYQAQTATNISQLFTFDNTNFIFLMLGLALHYRPIYFLKAVEEAGRSVWGIIIQFPFYAGIFGLFTYTQLGEWVSRSFAALSTAHTFPLLTYWYVGLLNYFVPSGGSEWLITSPYLVPAPATVGIPADRLIMSFAWGNMMTDMIQPFYAIPLLSIAKVQFRQIMGNLLLVFFLYFIITSVAFGLLPRL